MFDIKKLQPCDGGLSYFSGKPNFEAAWNSCERGTWMLWTADKLRVDSSLVSTVIRRSISQNMLDGIRNSSISSEDERRIANVCREVLTDAVLEKVKQNDTGG
jgi:hypothetical protein